MSRRFLQLGRPTSGHHFQADRYSFGERRQRRERSISYRLAAWWARSSRMERFFRIWLWSVLAFVAGGIGACVGVIFG